MNFGYVDSLTDEELAQLRQISHLIARKCLPDHDGDDILHKVYIAVKDGDRKPSNGKYDKNFYIGAIRSIAYNLARTKRLIAETKQLRQQEGLEPLYQRDNNEDYYFYCSIIEKMIAEEKKYLIPVFDALSKGLTIREIQDELSITNHKARKYKDEYRTFIKIHFDKNFELKSG